MPPASSTTLTLTLWRRPLLWIPAILAIAAYWDPVALRGPFVYDDVASINNNPVVKAEVPWTEALTRDFWGTPMSEPQSHKSYRPITTLTLRLNYIWAMVSGAGSRGEGTYSFHAFNIILHGINTGLVTEAAAIVFGEEYLIPPLTAGIIFGIHPVHAEAVSNITGRGELLMAFFYVLAFLSYANNIPEEQAKNSHQSMHADKVQAKKGKKGAKGGNKESKSQTTNNSKPTINAVGGFRSLVCIYVLPCLFMSLSMFSKEQGATTLCTVVAFDFLKNHSSVQQFIARLKDGDAYSGAFLKRTSILAIETLALVWIRWMLNGESSPDFV